MPRASEGENDDALGANLRSEHLFDVKGRVVVVSGGGSGIGAMIAAAFAQNGATVHIFSRKDTSEFAARLSAGGGGPCHAHIADALKPADIAGVVAAVERASGRVDVLVNNAGTNYAAPMGEADIAMFKKVLDVNVTAAFGIAQAFFPLLQRGASAQRPSAVINIGSINGIEPPVSQDTFAYSASKAAITMLSRHMAARLAPEHITVNTLAPGPFRSRMMRGLLAKAERVIVDGTLMKRLGAPGDIAGAVLLLASPAGSWLTGCTLPVDGGSLLSKF